MDQISLYLKKYENLGFKELDLKRKIITVIKEETGLDLNQDDIEIHEKDLRIKVSGSAKAEIFLKRSNIEKKMNDIRSIL